MIHAGGTMRIIDTIPGHTQASLMSAIINLTCPQCGGRMMDYQCDGRCGRNWLPEWEWAIQLMGMPKAASRRG